MMLSFYCDTRLIDCRFLNVQWQLFHAYSGKEQVQQLSISKTGWDGTQQGNGCCLPLEKKRDGQGRKIKPFVAALTYSFSEILQ